MRSFINNLARISFDERLGAVAIVFRECSGKEAYLETLNLAIEMALANKTLNWVVDKRALGINDLEMVGQALDKWLKVGSEKLQEYGVKGTAKVAILLPEELKHSALAVPIIYPSFQKEIIIKICEDEQEVEEMMTMAPSAAMVG